jgi:hypothetical protein
MAGARSPRRKTVTLCVTVTAPGWLRKAALRREVRTLINDGAPWGAVKPDSMGFESIDLGDIRVKRMR